MKFTALILILSIVYTQIAAAPAQTPTPAAIESPLPCGARVGAVDQSAIYAQNRDYATLSANSDSSFPDLLFFLGLNGVRCSHLLGAVPTYVPVCAADSGQNSLADRLKAAHATTGMQAISDEIRQAYRDISGKVYRLRACDFLLSVFAWNTRGKGHQASFDYSWRTACNSFAYESENGAKLTQAVNALLTQSGSPNALRDALTQFAYTNYDLYDDLSARLTSCAAIVNGLTYPPNTNRFFCRYGGFIGAMLTASAAAFGKRWGGTNKPTQAQVQALGTVLVATPALCQNAPATGPKG